jgi:hypothetical protein
MSPRFSCARLFVGVRQWRIREYANITSFNIDHKVISTYTYRLEIEGLHPQPWSGDR